MSMEIQTFQVTRFYCPQCCEIATMDVDIGQTLRHSCGWGGMITALFRGHGFCIDAPEPTPEPEEVEADEDGVLDSRTLELLERSVERTAPAEKRVTKPLAVAGKFMHDLGGEIQTNIELDRQGADVVLNLLGNPPKPTPALSSLMASPAAPALTPREPHHDSMLMLRAVEALAAVNREYLKKNAVPTVMLADLRVKRCDSEARRSIPALLHERSADVDELAAWRLAELLERGEKASLRILWSERGVPVLLVQRQNGTCEIVDELMKGRLQ